MTQTMDAAKKMQRATHNSFSPKPKPCVAGGVSEATASFSPKPKPYVSSGLVDNPASFSPKPKPCVASSSSDRLAGFSPKPKPCVLSASANDLTRPLSRIAAFDRAEGSVPSALPALSGMGSKPVVTNRWMNMFRGMIRL